MPTISKRVFISHNKGKSFTSTVTNEEGLRLLCSKHNAGKIQLKF